MNPVPTILLAIVVLASVVTTPPVVKATTCEDGTTPAYLQLQTTGYAGGYGCELVFDSSAGIVFVQVTMNAMPARRVRFALPDPPAGTVVGEEWNFPYSGDRLNGLEVDLTGCTGEGLVVLGTLAVFVTPGTKIDCLPWNVAEGCEVQDCDGRWRTAMAWQSSVVDPTVTYTCPLCCWQCCQALPPHTMLPPDGATGVATDLTLSWSGPPYIPDPQLEEFFDVFVRVSTDPACGTGETTTVPPSDRTFAPAGLQLETTYYWQVSWVEYAAGCSSGYEGMSPVQSFTTAEVLAATPSTWGQVKFLYRQ